MSDGVKTLDVKFYKQSAKFHLLPAIGGYRTSRAMKGKDLRAYTSRDILRIELTFLWVMLQIDYVVARWNQA